MDAWKKRIYTAAGLFLAAALVLGGCGKEKVPESEFATADEAKEALTSAYVSMSYRWFNEYKLSFLFGVGAFFVEQLRRAHECARAHSI